MTKTLSTRLIATTLALNLFAATHSLACDKRGHDCRVETGSAGLSDLPFRVADQRGFFDRGKTHPDIAFGQDRDRLKSVLSGEALVALISPLELQPLVTKDRRLKIVAVLQVKPSTFFVTKGPADLRAIKGDAVGVMGRKTADAAYTMLAFSRQQLRPNQDYKMAFIQGDSTRLNALEGRTISAAVLQSSGALAAQKMGLNVFPMLNYVPSVANTIIVGRQDLLEIEASGLKGMLVALRAAVQRIQNREYREEVISVIQKSYEISDKRNAEFIYEALIRQDIYSADFKLTPALVKATDELLAQVGATRHWELFDSRYLPLARTFTGNSVATMAQ